MGAKYESSLLFSSLLLCPQGLLIMEPGPGPCLARLAREVVAPSRCLWFSQVLSSGPVRSRRTITNEILPPQRLGEAFRANSLVGHEVLPAGMTGRVLECCLLVGADIVKELKTTTTNSFPSTLNLVHYICSVWLIE